MKELSMLSLICSCFNPRLQKNLDSKTDCKAYFSLTVFELQNALRWEIQLDFLIIIILLLIIFITNIIITGKNL